MTIAERAEAAHALLRQSARRLPVQEYLAADIARTIGRLAALLGIDPAQVRPDGGWTRIVRRGAPIVLQATDPDDPDRTYTFSYRDPLFDDEPFHLLGPCPQCGAQVPLAEIVRLADLGAFLADGPAPIPAGGHVPDTYPEEFEGHPSHRSTCGFRAGEA
jgi:hypothetical protein